jgi:thioredoxin 1
MKNLKQYGLIAAGIILILATGIIIAFSQPTSDSSTEKAPSSNDKTANPAAEIGEGETRITDENFENEIKSYKGIAIVDFYSPTCPYCQKVGPIISEIAKEVGGKYKIGKIDVTANPKTVATLNNFKSVPALIFYKDGQEVDRIIGFKEKSEILAKLEEVSKK